MWLRTRQRRLAADSRAGLPARPDLNPPVIFAAKNSAARSRAAVFPWRLSHRETSSLGRGTLPRVAWAFFQSASPPRTRPPRNRASGLSIALPNAPAMGERIGVAGMNW